MKYNIKLSKGKININGKEYDISDEKAKIIVDKEFEFDGYKGILKKELVFKVSDFEKITLIIKEDLVEKVESDE